MSETYEGKPFKWDRPGEGAYPGDTLRIYEKNPDGSFKSCRRATDEEVRFIMLYELTASQKK